MSPVARGLVQERTPRWTLMQRIVIRIDTRGRKEAEARLERLMGDAGLNRASATPGAYTAPLSYLLVGQNVWAFTCWP